MRDKIRLIETPNYCNIWIDNGGPYLWGRSYAKHFELAEPLERWFDLMDVDFSRRTIPGRKDEKIFHGSWDVVFVNEQIKMWFELTWCQ